MSRLPWQAVWFRDDNNFLYANSPSPPFDVPAYSGTFREHPTFREFPSMRRVQLCMLHTDDIPNFPDTSFVEDTYVKCCTEQTGLSLHGKVSYGYCCITCCRREWIGWYCFHCGQQRWWMRKWLDPNYKVIKRASTCTKTFITIVTIVIHTIIFIIIIFIHSIPVPRIQNV